MAPLFVFFFGRLEQMQGAVTSESFVYDINTLVSQLETFDVGKCNVAVESDRKVILERINELYEGGVPEFNNTLQSLLVDEKDGLIARWVSEVKKDTLLEQLFSLASSCTLCWAK